MLGTQQPAYTQRDIAEKVKRYIDDQLDQIRSGRTSPAYNGHSDANLILELMARGYAVWKPPVGE